MVGWVGGWVGGWIGVRAVGWIREATALERLQGAKVPRFLERVQRGGSRGRRGNVRACVVSLQPGGGRGFQRAVVPASAPSVKRYRGTQQANWVPEMDDEEAALVAAAKVAPPPK